MMQVDLAPLVKAFEEGDPQAQNRTAYGDRSLLSEALRSVGGDRENGSPADPDPNVAGRIADALGQILELSVLFGDQNSLALGLQHSMAAVVEMQQEKDASADLAAELGKAAQHLDAIWPNGGKTSSADLKSEETCDVVWQAFVRGLPECTPETCCALWRLLDLVDWNGREPAPWSLRRSRAGQSDTDGEQTEGRNEVTTPILAAAFTKSESRHLLLKMRLVFSPGGQKSWKLPACVFPDLTRFGLLVLKCNCMDSMRRCWGLARMPWGTSAMWSLCDAGIANRNENKYTIDSLEGPSMEAATLVALRALTGDPYGLEWKDLRFSEKLDEADKKKIFDDPKAMELLGKVPISATVAKSTTKDTPFKDIKFDTVGDCEEKVVASNNGLLDTVLFSEAQLEIKEGKGAVDPQDRQIYEHERDGHLAPNYGGVRVRTVSTLYDALDQMLAQNRLSRDYQNAGRNIWLGQWQNGTARATNDDAWGPDRLNLPLPEDAHDDGKAAPQ